MFNKKNVYTEKYIYPRWYTLINICGVSFSEWFLRILKVIANSKLCKKKNSLLTFRWKSLIPQNKMHINIFYHTSIFSSKSKCPYRHSREIQVYCHLVHSSKIQTVFVLEPYSILFWQTMCALSHTVIQLVYTWLQRCSKYREIQSKLLHSVLL